MRYKLLTISMVVLLTSASGTAMSFAQTEGSDCGVEEAADAALQQQIALIDAAKVNVPDFFNGAKGSCISSDMFKSFDLSSMIPDMAGFMKGGLANVAQNLISKAKYQACEILNEQLDKMLGKMRGAVDGMAGKVGGEMASLLGGSSGGLQLPNIKGIGKYDFTSGTQPSFETDGQAIESSTRPQFSLSGQNLPPQSEASPVTDNSRLDAMPSGTPADISNFADKILGQ